MANIANLENVINSDVFRKLVDNHNILIQNLDILNNSTINIENTLGLPLNNLETVNRDDIISAINEVFLKVNSGISGIGDISQLNTDDKSNLVSAINEVLGELNTIVDDIIGEWTDTNRTEKVKPAIESLENKIGSATLTTNSDTLSGAINELVTKTDSILTQISTFAQSISDNTAIIEKLQTYEIGPTPPDNPVIGQRWKRVHNATLQNVTAIGGESWIDGVRSGVSHNIRCFDTIKMVSVFYLQETEPTAADVNLTVTNEIYYRYFWINSNISIIKEWDRWKQKWVLANLNEFHIKTLAEESLNPSEDKLYLLTVDNEYFNESIQSWDGTKWVRDTVDVRFGEEWGSDNPLPGDILYRPIQRKYYLEAYSFIAAQNDYVKIINSATHYSNYNEYINITYQFDGGVPGHANYNSVNPLYFYKLQDDSPSSFNRESNYNGSRLVTQAYNKPDILDPYKLWIKTLISAEPSANHAYVWSGTEWNSLGVVSRFKFNPIPSENIGLWYNTEEYNLAVKNNYILWSNENEVILKTQNYLELYELSHILKFINHVENIRSISIVLCNDLNNNLLTDSSINIPFILWSDSLQDIFQNLDQIPVNRISINGILSSEFDINNEINLTSDYVTGLNTEMDDDAEYVKGKKVQSIWKTCVQTKSLDGNDLPVILDIIRCKSIYINALFIHSCIDYWFFSGTYGIYNTFNLINSSNIIITNTCINLKNTFNRGFYIADSDIITVSNVIAVSNFYTTITNSATLNSHKVDTNFIFVLNCSNIKISNIASYQFSNGIYLNNSSVSLYKYIKAFKGLYGINSYNSKSASDFTGSKFEFSYLYNALNIYENSSVNLLCNPTHVNTIHDCTFAIRVLRHANCIIKNNISITNNGINIWDSFIPSETIIVSDMSNLALQDMQTVSGSVGGRTINSSNLSLVKLSGPAISNFIKNPSTNGGNSGAYIL